MFEILARIPLYVWPLFVFLIWAGRRESRTHLVRPWQVVLPAAIMSLYGLYGTGDTYGWSGFALGAWGPARWPGSSCFLPRVPPPAPRGGTPRTAAISCPARTGRSGFS